MVMAENRPKDLLCQQGYLFKMKQKEVGVMQSQKVFQKQYLAVLVVMQLVECQGRGRWNSPMHRESYDTDDTEGLDIVVGCDWDVQQK